MKVKIVSLLIAASLIILAAFPVAAQQGLYIYNYLGDGEAPTQHPEDEALELTATPSTTEGNEDVAGEADPSDPPDPPDPAAAVPAQDEIEITPFNIGGDGTVAKFVADNHVIMVRGDSRVFVWGDNTYGQLGLGAAAPAIVYDPTELTFFKDMGASITDIAVCEDATFVLLSNAELYSFGKGTNGRLGIGNSNNVKVPTLVAGSQALRFSKLYTGKEYIIAETENNELYAWGRNNKGQLGTGTTTDASSPVKIMDNANVKELNLGEDFVTLLKTDNTYWTWGSNEAGRYGFDTGTIAPDTTTLTNTGTCAHVNVTTNVTGYGKGTFGFAGTSACSPLTHTRLTTTCSGFNTTYSGYNGVKGNNQQISVQQFATPQQIAATGRSFTHPSTIAAVWNPTGTANTMTNNIMNFSSTGGTSSHTHSAPSKTFTCTVVHAFYTSSGGGSTVNQAHNTPSYSGEKTSTGTSAVGSATVSRTGQAASWRYTLPNAFSYFDTSKIQSLEVGNRHGLVNINGTFYGWGANTMKQQGTSGDANGYMVPLTQLNTFIKDLDNTGGGFNHLKVAGDTGYILSSDGKVYSWGGNTSGKAGQGSAAYVDTPTLITSLAGKSIASIVSGRNTAFYIAHDGSVAVSGDNMYGQTGLGEAQKDNSKVTAPVIIDDLKFSATELPPDAPDSMDHPNEVETEQEIEIQWTPVSSAAGYELKRYFTPVQQTFGIMTIGEEETEILYSGNQNTFTDTAPNEAGTLTYSVKALNYINDYSPAKMSDGISVIDNGSGSGGTDDDNNNNGNNNGGGSGLTEEQFLQLLATLKSSGVDENLITAILASSGVDENLITALIASNKPSGSGGVSVNVPASGMDDKTLAALIAALAASNGGNTGQTGTPATNVYNQPPDYAGMVTALLGVSDPNANEINGILPIEHYVVKLMFEKMFPAEQPADVSTQTTSAMVQPDQLYDVQQQSNRNQKFLNIAIISAILVLVLVGCAVKFIPEGAKEETDE